MDEMAETHPQNPQNPALDQLAAALAKAQGAMKGALKDSENPHFRSRYADLAAVWDACREPLTANGLSVVQCPGRDGEEVTVTTMLLHASGQVLSSTLGVRPFKPDAQGIGSAITYLRRYALAAMVGIAPEDDDGEAAVGRGKGPAAQAPPPPPKPVKIVEVSQQEAAREVFPDAAVVPTITAAQHKALEAAIRTFATAWGDDPVAVRSRLKEKLARDHGIEHLTEMPPPVFDELMRRLGTRPKAAKA